MHISRARYVVICQQFLVTAVVMVVGLSAAGVMTLQIVAPEGHAPRASSLAPAVRVSDAYADTRPVTPQVREVKVAGIDSQAAHDIPGVVTTPDATAPGSTARAKGSRADTPTRLAALSAPTPVHGYATVGVTWKPGTKLPEDAIRVQVRTRSNGVWSGWTTAAYHDEHGPDAGTPEAAKVRPGTDAVVIGDVDEVQMKADTLTGAAPADLELAVIDPGTGTVTKQPAAIDTSKLPAADTAATSSRPVERTTGTDTSAAQLSSGAGDAAALTAMAVSPKPVIYSRAQWGANESLRDKSSLRYGTIKTGFIHHTVNANNYTAEQVPALIRGIYAYHTQTRGWSDIGYNFLVDRFGRIWEGRYGGVDRPVVGAHTLGYNEYSFAMSAIGNFDIASPPQAVLDAYARLFAWKLSLSNIRADATRLWVKDRYLQAINGHRDVGQTACPGRYLYARIPSIRLAAKAIQDAAQTPPDPVTLAPVPAPAGLPAPTQAPAPAASQPAIGFPRAVNLTGSSWPDLLVATTTGVIAVVPTEGALDYNRVTSNRGPWHKMSIIAAVGDLTGDRKSDVIAKNSTTRKLRVYPGDGSGHVGKGIAPTAAFKRVDQIVGVHDFNRDGHDDVAGRDRKTGNLVLFRGTGDGHFKPAITLRRNWTFTQTAGVGDVNGDRQPDLVATMDGRTLYLVPGARRGKSVGRSILLGTTSTRGALLGWGDLDSDRRADVLSVSAGLATMYSGVGQGGAGKPYGPFDAMAGLTKLSMSQMTGSGAADVVGRDSAGRLVVVANNGARGISAPLSPNLVVPGATQVLDVGDWNGDGKGDVVVRTQDRDTLLLYPGLGNGRFGRPYSLGAGWKPVVSLAAVGDVTGDRRPDLIGRTATGPMTIYPGAGSSGYGAPVLAPAQMRTFNQIGTSSWPTSGSVIPSVTGSFVPVAGSSPAAALRMANGTTSASYDHSVGLGDVTGDGVADLLAREKGTGVIWLLPGKASGGFSPRMWVAAGFAGYRLVG